LELQLQFEWDPRKGAANLRKHGFDLADAVPMFEEPMLAQPDTREDYGEERWIGIGTTNGRVAVVAFAECGEDCIRIISLRKANRHERELFEEAVKNQLEED
jgi:hypothetical protein